MPYLLLTTLFNHIGEDLVLFAVVGPFPDYYTTDSKALEEWRNSFIKLAHKEGCEASIDIVENPDIYQIFSPEKSVVDVFTSLQENPYLYT